MFRIGSITKQFTAAAIMRLIEQGHVGLDDSMNKYLPDFPTRGHTVTIRHLLTHTSGIASYTSDESFMRDRTANELTHDQVLAEFKDDPFDFAPGEKWAYNNSGYYLFGMIVEKVSGKSYAAYVQDEFFTRLGLTRSRYDSSSDVIKNRAQGYRVIDGKVANDKPMAKSIPGGAGGLMCSAGDLVRWQMALVSGNVVSEESFAMMTTPVVLPDGKSTEYGFGLALQTYRDHASIGHDGGITGFNSMMKYLPAEKLHIAVISNSESAGSNALWDAIAKEALAIRAEMISDLPLTAAEVERYVGSFKFEQIQLDTRIFVEDGKLMVQGKNQPSFRLLFQGDSEFRAEFDHDVKLVFDAEGEKAASFVLQQGGGRQVAKRVE